MLKLTILGSNQTEVSLDNKRVLFSYNTPVAAWVSGIGYIRTDKKFSVTTSKHIALWLAGIGVEARTVPQSEIEALLS